ncbi:MAG: error-prone DNA polymerase [Phycisphaerae bacterium]|nr:error-prone DNA polymerase [Phycisphaerae bacterium]
MPDRPPSKILPHPWHSRDGESSPSGDRTVRSVFVDLVVASNYSFLRGASQPEELVREAAKIGAEAIAITDRHSVAGVVRAHVTAKEVGIRLVPGTRIELWRDRHGAEQGEDWERRTPYSPPEGRVEVALHATSVRGWATICRLLTIGKRRTSKGRCRLVVHDLLEHHADVLVTLLPVAPIGGFEMEFLEGLLALTDLGERDALSMGVQRLDGPEDERHLQAAVVLGARIGVPLLVQNDVHMHTVDRRRIQDVLTCIRHGCTLETAGRRLHPGAVRRLYGETEMLGRFADLPEAVARTGMLADRSSGWSMDDLKYRYPAEIVPEGATPMSHLRSLVSSGARERFGSSIPEAVGERLEHEFSLIEELDYARYFLTVDDIVRFARSRGILCQGRGAAANSVVCYCLGMTAVDPTRVDMLFERFISRERDEPPDIDIDFEHERREEVMQYVYQRYGRERAALIAAVISYRGRSAIRDVGVVLGLSADLVQRLSADIDWWSDGIVDAERVRGLGIDPEAPAIRRLFEIASGILGFPRHLSQHVGGFVIADRPLWEMVPVENAAMPDRTVIEWDKDDVDAMGMLKIDCLALGMLSCIRKTLDLVNEDRSSRPSVDIQARTGPRRMELHTIPAEDPKVYDMISAADTVGVFQIESRAQMSMLPRLRPRCYYDLVIEVAIVRPGPIQGDMVHPYLRRRNGEAPVEYPDEAIRRVLQKTLGVPLFQEQAMALAVVAAGFTPGEADALRRAIAAWKRHGNAIAAFGQRLESGMAERGYEPKFVRQVFTQIQGFSGYGFPESHAASFALLVYASSWLKCREPAAFAAALINSQPMGFYAPAQIVRDARDHAVEVRRIDIAASDWDCTLERTVSRPWDQLEDDGDGRDQPRRRTTVAVDQPAIRLGLRLVRGLGEHEARRLVAAVRSHGPFTQLDELRRAAGVSMGVLRRLARADAFRSMGFNRQQSTWHLQKLRDEALPLFDSAIPQEDRTSASDSGSTGRGGISEPRAALPSVPPIESIADDYAASGLSLERHPLACLRPVLARGGVRCAVELDDPAVTPDGVRISVAGVVLVRQRPSTAGGIVFMTLEDETGTANLVFKPRVYRRHRRLARHEVGIVAAGRIERRGDVVHLVVGRVERLPVPQTEPAEDGSGVVDGIIRPRDFR